MRKLIVTAWRVWQHGAMIAVIYTLGVFVGSMYAILPAFLIAQLSGWNISNHDWEIYSLVVALPLGLGVAARHSPTDALKPDGYPEPPPSQEIL
jgi:hypothetical protein